MLIEGVIIPESPVDSAANVLPDREKAAEPRMVETGGITPSLPLKLLVNVEPEVEITVPPVETMVISSPGEDREGGITPESAVEKKVAVLPDTVALPAI